jgi:serine/threonine protein kinase
VPLSLGDRFGPYEIVALLGAGGMGEVYRARDSKLNRDVAIKVLPATLAGDAQYMARFEREAQTLAALNHPNIATVYGIEQGALVMELVEGANLCGPLPLDEAIPIARQIAEGLEAAHERGIVHRDLKPANIKLTPAGLVKILDFGLAKTNGDAAPSSPGWAKGGKELFSRANDGTLMDVEVRTGGSNIETSIPKPLFKFGTGSLGNTFGVTADGKRFLIREAVQSEEVERQAITLVLNWAADLKQ